MQCHHRAAVVIAASTLLAAGGCCPVPPGGPSATGVTRVMALAPGAIDFLDVDVPPSTTQLNVEISVETADWRLRVRQIEPDCAPGPGDSCPSRRDSMITPPAGVRRVTAYAVAIPGARTRIVLENVSGASLTVTLTLVPWRAGCTCRIESLRPPQPYV